ncbi:MAG: ABC transporter substrate-binding protein [Ruminococcus sp.]|nr:ABC transporter substrate-binding protein [Ruminococcus sp.]
MKNIKRAFALTLSLMMAFGIAGCGNSSSSGNSSDESFEATDNIEVQENKEIADIPDGAEKTILYLGENDLNPTKANPEISTEMKLFQQHGGAIEWHRCTNEGRFDALAKAITANKDVPDIFNYEWLSFPAQVVNNMFQPIDEIVDFESPMWKSSKTTADQFVLNNKHYVAPLGYDPSAVITYDKKLVEELGMEDPFELYKKGEWNWTNFKSIMEEYVAGGTAEDERYGINGFFRPHITQQTGKTLVSFDPATSTFSSNLTDPDIEAAQQFLYDLKKENLMLDGWIGSASECFQKNCFFYGMGAWAVKPGDGDEWGIVPMPQYDKNPQKITTSDMKAFMWVDGSTKKDAVKCWFECYKSARTDPQYEQTNKDKFFENNSNWTEDMYSVFQDITSDDYFMIFDYAYGVSFKLGDRMQFDGNQCLTDALYNSSSSEDEDGLQMTWTQVRETYSSTVDSEIATLNKDIEKYIADNK